MHRPDYGALIGGAYAGITSRLDTLEAELCRGERGRLLTVRHAFGARHIPVGNAPAPQT